jgi:ribosome-associated toxin RatA of RatAB toxin-antitoxin module
MRSTQSVIIAAAPSFVFPFVSTLDQYPHWLPLVHKVEPTDAAHGEVGPSWLVEIRARVGLFTRSKQLRMTRTTYDNVSKAEFERAEIDGRDHARWALRAELAELPSDEGTSTQVTMHLAYDGSLWGGAILDRVLDAEIKRGRKGLAALVNDARKR